MGSSWAASAASSSSAPEALLLLLLLLLLVLLLPPLPWLLKVSVALSPAAWGAGGALPGAPLLLGSAPGGAFTEIPGNKLPSSLLPNASAEVGVAGAGHLDRIPGGSTLCSPLPAAAAAPGKLLSLSSSSFPATPSSSVSGASRRLRFRLLTAGGAEELLCGRSAIPCCLPVLLEKNGLQRSRTILARGVLHPPPPGRGGSPEVSSGGIPGYGWLAPACCASSAAASASPVPSGDSLRSHHMAAT